MSRPWPQERNTSLSFALEFLREPQSWNQLRAAKTQCIDVACSTQLSKNVPPEANLGSPHRGATRNEGDRHHLRRLSVPAVEHYEG